MWRRLLCRFDFHAWDADGRCFGCGARAVGWGIEYTQGLYELLWQRHAAWSRKTFGADDVRGPEGPLKHLRKEVEEALAQPQDKHEYADLLLLVMDSARRAGLTSRGLVLAGFEKLAINEQRTWPALTDVNEPVFHERDASDG